MIKMQNEVINLASAGNGAELEVKERTEERKVLRDLIDLRRRCVRRFKEFLV